MATQQRLKTSLITIAILGVGLYATLSAWDAYRSERRRSFAGRALSVAADLRPAIAERIQKNLTGSALAEGVQISPRPPITEGYVSPDGAIVVHAELDYFTPFDVILRPMRDATTELTWICGVGAEAQRRYSTPNCQKVFEIPRR